MDPTRRNRRSRATAVAAAISIPAAVIAALCFVMTFRTAPRPTTQYEFDGDTSTTMQLAHAGTWSIYRGGQPPSSCRVERPDGTPIAVSEAPSGRGGPTRLTGHDGYDYTQAWRFTAPSAGEYMIECEGGTGTRFAVGPQASSRLFGAFLAGTIVSAVVAVLAWTLIRGLTRPSPPPGGGFTIDATQVKWVADWIAATQRRQRGADPATDPYRGPH